MTPKDFDNSLRALDPPTNFTVDCTFGLAGLAPHVKVIICNTRHIPKIAQHLYDNLPATYGFSVGTPQ